MADKTDKILLHGLDESQGNEKVDEKWVDQGDGTFAKVIQAVLASGSQIIISSGEVSIPDLLIPDTFKTLKGVAIGSIATVWTPASGKKIRLIGGSISVSAAVSVLFEDNGAGTDVWQTPVLTANTPYNFDLGNGKLLSAIDNVLKATSSGAANITGTLYGIEV